MALHWYEKPEDSGSLTRDKGTGARSVNHVRVFYVRSDSSVPTIKDVLTHPKCPKINQEHPDDNLAFVGNVRTRRLKKDPMFHKVTATYSEFFNEWEKNPLLERVKGEWQSTEYRVQTYFDENQRLMINTAEDPRHYEAIRSNGYWKVSCNLPNYSKWLNLYNARGAVNQEQIRIGIENFPPGTLLLKALQYKDWLNWGKTIRYIPTTFELHFKWEGWWIEEYSQGKRELVTFKDKDDGYKTKKRLDPIMIGKAGKEEPATTDEYLDDKGRHLVQPVDEADLVLLKHWVQPRFRFLGRVPIPQSP